MNRKRSGAPYAVCTIGPVRVVSPDSPDRPLSVAKRRLLALLVAVGPEGIAADHLAAELGGRDRGLSAPALRMAIARLRDHLPDGWLPEAASSRYRLVCAADAIDAWDLERAVRTHDIDGLDDDRLAHLLRATEVFGEIDGSAAIDQAAADVVRRQGELLAAVLEQSAERITGPMLAWMRQHCEADPYNERLAVLAATRLAQIGDRRGALAALNDCRRRLIEIGLDASIALADLESQLLRGTFEAPVEAPSEHRPGRLPSRLRDHLQFDFVGDRTSVDTAIEHLATDAARVPFVVEGASGSGKTRWLAELALGASECGIGMVYVAGNEATVQGSLAPFLAGVPGFEERAEAIYRSAPDAPSRRAELWVALRHSIANHTATARRLVIVDDAQWLDSQSSEFVAHLVAAVGSDTGVAIAARSDHSAREGWAVLRDAVLRAGAEPVALEAMTVEEIRDIIRSRHPRLTATTAWALASEAHERGAGRPGMAIVLLSSLDDDWRLPATRSLNVPHSLFEELGRRLSPDALEMGRVAAVIGEQFDLRLATRVSGMGLDAALDAVDELVRHDLLVERNPTTFATAHALVDAAFLQTATRSELVRFHHTAAQITSADPHRRARHLVEALPLVDGEIVASALLDSARAYAGDDLHLEASRRFRAAVDVRGAALDPVDAAEYSRALDLTGLHTEAEEVRSAAFEIALASGDADLALRCATSGLPEAEPIDGAPAMVARLARIPVDHLARPAAWRLEHQLARQLAIIGDLDAARAAADRATAIAIDRQEVVASAMLRRFAISATTPPAARSRILDGVAGLVGGVSPAVEGEYWVLQAIDRYEAGERDAAIAAHDRVRRLPGLPIVRRWHADLLEAMIAADDGDAEGAAELRRRAFDAATRAGLWEAENAFLIGEFTELFLAGEAGALIGGVESGSIDPEINTLMRAGAAAVLAGAGMIERALPHAERVADSVLRSPVSQGVSALAFVAEVLGSSPDRELCERARQMLMSRGPSAVVVGAGAACLGPVERYAAMLAIDARTRDEHLSRARDFARAAGVERWVATVDRDAERTAG